VLVGGWSSTNPAAASETFKMSPNVWSAFIRFSLLTGSFARRSDSPSKVETKIVLRTNVPAWHIAPRPGSVKPRYDTHVYDR
jgi:hypothetical protein